VGAAQPQGFQSRNRGITFQSQRIARIIPPLPPLPVSVPTLATANPACLAGDSGDSNKVRLVGLLACGFLGPQRYHFPWQRFFPK
jgi:hypothetical protein